MGEGAGTAKKQAGKHTMMVMDEEEEAWRMAWADVGRRRSLMSMMPLEIGQEFGEGVTDVGNE